MNPRITVLMSVFNEQAYLREAVESILGQTFSDFEFLIIDDGSEEPFEDVIGEYKDERIRLLRQKNMGLARSLNRGLRLARGRYIARMDADDTCRSDRLELQVKEMEAHPQIDLLGSFFDVIDGEGRVIEIKELITDPIYRLWRLQFHNNYGHGTVMLKKDSLLKQGTYDETLLYAQDYDLWSRISRKDNSSMIPKVLYHYRMVEQSGQASVRNYDAQFATAINISDRNLQACNPTLSETDCKEVRALYWKFQMDDITLKGLQLLPKTLDSFCRRYEINAADQRDLVERVARDAIAEVENSNVIPAGDRQRLMDELERKLLKPLNVRLE